MRLNLSLKYIASITVILLIVMGITLGVISKRHEQLIMSQIEMQAKALFQQVVITRRWIADHGGVYVEQLPWTKVNPFLANATIRDMQGKRYVRENPAMVTKQLSQYSQKEGLYVFHITSLKLTNPENAPDEFEARALKDFELKKVKEASEISRLGNSRYFRYIAPLYVEKACLKCHAKQGYSIGDVRGGISVTMPMDYAFAELSSDRRSMVYGGLTVAAALMLSLFLMTQRMVITPINTMMTFMSRFSKNGDPKVPLLKTGDELEALSRSFNDMAKTLDEYHTCLQAKIKAATQELTDKNEALARSSQSKSDFIARTSHELRTPLTAIKGAMDYLSVKLAMREADEDQDLIVFFEMIKKNADRLIRLVNNILDYERIGLGAVEMNFRETGVKDVFQEVVAGFALLAAEKHVTIRTKAMDVTARIDEDRIKQVLTNLLSNALNFSPDPGKILVTLECRDASVYASVEDMGVRIPEDERENIFKQYYTKNTANGTGLGLAICRGIIESHGGELGVEDSHLGGSRFWFRIPKQGKEPGGDEKTTACDR